MNLKPTLTIRMEAELYARVKLVSEYDKRSMAQWCRIAIEREVERCEGKSPTQPNDFADNVVG